MSTSLHNNLRLLRRDAAPPPPPFSPGPADATHRLQRKLLHPKYFQQNNSARVYTRHASASNLRHAPSLRLPLQVQPQDFRLRRPWARPVSATVPDHLQAIVMTTPYPLRPAALSCLPIPALSEDSPGSPWCLCLLRPLVLGLKSTTWEKWLLYVHAITVRGLAARLLLYTVL